MSVDCPHPFEALTVDPGRSGQRGHASTFRLVCGACKAVFPGPLGIRQLVVSGVTDNEAIWRAVQALGGRRHDMVRPQARGESMRVDKGDCAHYLAWLAVDTGGAGTRGYSGAIWIRCRGCKTKWTESVGLSVFLERLVEERRAIALAIKGLGGQV